MRKLFQFLNERIFEMRLKRAIRKADQMHELTGHRYMVIRWKNELIVKSKKHLKNAIRSHRLKCSLQQLEDGALYITK